MNDNFMKNFLFLLALLITNARADDASVNDLAAKYKRASSEKGRMNVCIEAIDRGILSQGSSVQAFDAIFGTNWVAELPSAGEPMEKGFVNFAEQLKVERDDEQTPFVGWYCAIEFDSHGIIHSYYLSKSHK